MSCHSILHIYRAGFLKLDLIIVYDNTEPIPGQLELTLDAKYHHTSCK